MQFKSMTNKYIIKRFAEADLPEIYELCKANTTYYGYMKMRPTLDNLREALTEVPPGITLDDKYFIGFYDNNQLVALLDVCAGYPKDDTAYIGWFMMRKELQRRGAELLDEKGV